jgi:type II secretory pathway component PulK
VTRRDIALLRPGFALLTILWVTAILAIVGTAATVEAREALNSSRNRVWLERAFWIASGCVALAERAVSDVLAEEANDLARAERWRALAQRVELRTPAMRRECSMSLAADGDALDVNRASEAALVAYFAASGLGADRNDLAQAILDWRDEDSESRPLGAEDDWYRAQGRIPPRNGAFGDQAELNLVRGLESLSVAQLGGLSSVDARISVNTAPRAVLAAIPGFGPELIDRVRERSLSGAPVHDLLALERLVAADAAERVRAHFPEIVQAATVDPEAWRVTAIVRLGAPAVIVRVEARLIRSGSAVEVSNWRMQ